MSDGRGAGPLAIVTRPEPQAGEWVGKLRARGVSAAALPLLRIAAAPDAEAVRRAFRALRAGDVVMFVSPNAAAEYFACLPEGSCWPEGVAAAATGPGTVGTLVSCGVPSPAIVAPPKDLAQFDSEALWACLRDHDWRGRRVDIVRGDGGRPWLADQWRAAGAEVSFVQAYVRGAPTWDAQQQATLEQALARPASVCWLLSSSEALDHLQARVPAASWSAATALASHPRIAERARSLGFGRVMDTAPTLDAVVASWRLLAAGDAAPGPAA